MDDEAEKMDDRMAKIEQSVTQLAGRLDDLSLRFARKEEREKWVDEKLGDIKTEMNAKFTEVKAANERTASVLSRLNWIIILAVASAFMKFLLEGGLKIGP